MCGHAVVALARFAVERGLVASAEPETEVRVQCPCGLVTARVEVRDGRPGAVRFASVPCFAPYRDAVVLTRSFGPVTLDVGFGGAFYAVLPAADLGLDLATSPVGRLVEAAMEVKEAAARALTLTHPDADDLAFLYGTILADGGGGAGEPTTNVCVFADGQVDRSPTGSGVSTRLALMHRRGQVGVGETRRFRSITGGVFEGRVTAAARTGPHPAVITEVAGRAYHAGEAQFTVEPDDPLGWGFLLGR
jgi:trans-L-3-hydroxyproline dehydratase